MNKPKSQRITPATMTGEQIADAIMYGTYTKTALWSFISRNGRSLAVMVVQTPHMQSIRNWLLHFIS